MAINDPGVREENGGTVIQLAKRGEQVELIATSLQEFLKTLSGTQRTLELCGVDASEKNLRRLNGYTQQLLIIADELKSVGK